MSKKNEEKKVNKSALIREYYQTKLDAKPAEIVDHLAQQGIVVSAQQVSTTRMNAIKSGLLPQGNSAVRVVGTRRRGRPVGSGRSKQGNVSMTALLETKELIERVGFEDVKNAVTTLEQLMGN